MEINQWNSPLITGANGFIGSHLARLLSRQGCRVRALVRPGSSTRFLPGKIEIVRGDVINSRDLVEAAEGCDIIFHNAALASDWNKDPGAFSKVNVGGTRNVLNAADGAGIGRIVLTSSIGVMGEENCKVPKGLSSGFRPILRYPLEWLLKSDMNRYRKTKAEAEIMAREFCRAKKIDLKVVRPVWVYGPREFHAGPYIFCKSMLEGPLLFPGRRDNLFHSVFVEDLVKAMTAAGRRREKGVETFIVGPEKAETMREIWDEFCGCLGVGPPRYLPAWLTMPAGILMEFAWKAVAATKAPLLTRARVYMCYANNVYDTAESRRLLDLGPSTPLRVGVLKTVRWWRMNGFLSSHLHSPKTNARHGRHPICLP